MVITFAPQEAYGGVACPTEAMGLALTAVPAADGP